MIPLNITISGFLSYENTIHIDFETFGMACITGQNGAGKSSIIDAITWSLFGRARRQDDAIINANCQVANVQFVFWYEGNTYSAVRNKSRDYPEVLIFYRMDEQEVLQSLSARTLRETQAIIEQTLKMDYEMFVNVGVFMQGQADRFSQLPPSQRKEVLGSILGEDEWAKWKDVATQKRKEYEGELKNHENNAKHLQERLKGHEQFISRENEIISEMERLAEEIAWHERQVEVMIHELESGMAALIQEQKALEAGAVRVQVAEETIQKTATSIEEIEAMILGEQKNLEILSDLMAKNLEDRTRMQAEILSIEAEIKSDSARLSQLIYGDLNHCPLCEQELKAGALADLIKRLSEENENLKANLVEAQKILDEYRAFNRKYTHDEINLKEGLREHQAHLDRMQYELIDAQEIVNRWEANSKARYEEIAGQVIEYSGTSERDLRITQQNLKSLRTEHQSLAEEKGALAESKRAIADANARLDSMTKQINYLTTEISMYKILEKAFGRDGIPAMLIETAIPKIEAEANKILGILTGRKMTVNFVTQKMFKDANRTDLKETLEIQIRDGQGLRNREMFSGGEQFRIDFAIRVALAEILAQRAGARMQTLIIDEGFGSQDKEGRSWALEALNAIRGKFEKILVVSHLDDIQEAFPARIEVTKTDNGSVVNIVQN